MHYNNRKRITFYQKKYLLLFNTVVIEFHNRILKSQKIQNILTIIK